MRNARKLSWIQSGNCFSKLAFPLLRPMSAAQRLLVWRQRELNMSLIKTETMSGGKTKELSKMISSLEPIWIKERCGRWLTSPLAVAPQEGSAGQTSPIGPRAGRRRHQLTCSQTKIVTWIICLCLIYKRGFEETYEKGQRRKEKKSNSMALFDGTKD